MTSSAHIVEDKATPTAGAGRAAAAPPPLAVSPTLEINERVAELRRAGKDILHLGFGEAGLPVHPLFRDALASAAHLNSYGPVEGNGALRAAVAGWFTRRGLPTDAGLVAVTPGSKAGLFALLLALPGDVVLARPSWVSYAPQAVMLAKRVIAHPTPAVTGGIPDPATLPEALAHHRRHGLDPRIIVVTVPDNPTGTYPDAGLLAQLAEVACSEGLTIIADQIYAELAYDPAAVPDVAAMAPEATFVTTGLSKAFALGGWRFGVVRVPANELGERTRTRLRAIGSEIWSCVPGPIAAAAQIAYERPAELSSYLDDARAVHAGVCSAVYEIARHAGFSCRPPQAAFYVYPSLHDGGCPAWSADDLAAELLERQSVAVLPGTAFGDDPAFLRFRVATSLLYGACDEERWETLQSARQGNLLSLPRIASALDRVDAGFSALVAAHARVHR
jgi:aspartate aminotransferase